MLPSPGVSILPSGGSQPASVESIPREGGHNKKSKWDKVLWTVYGTHYSEENFREPRKFDPSRFKETIPQYVFLAFGGPRMCAGNQLAKLNILIFVIWLYNEFRIFSEII